MKYLYHVLSVVVGRDDPNFDNCHIKAATLSRAHDGDELGTVGALAIPVEDPDLTRKIPLGGDASPMRQAVGLLNIVARERGYRLVGPPNVTLSPTLPDGTYSHMFSFYLEECVEPDNGQSKRIETTGL